MTMGKEEAGMAGGLTGTKFRDQIDLDMTRLLHAVFLHKFNDPRFVYYLLLKNR